MPTLLIGTKKGGADLSEPKGCCCSEGGNTTCCGPERSLESADETGPERKRLDIDLLYLDLDTCTRCRETEVGFKHGVLASQTLQAIYRVRRNSGAPGMQRHGRENR